MEIYSSVIYDSITNPFPIAAEIPERLSLFHGYTIKAASSNSISSELPLNSYLNVSIYDVFGSEVTVLTNQNRKEDFKPVKWSADAYSSGIYFYRVNFGIYIQTGKLILLK
jgi:hypothetical protein